MSVHGSAIQGSDAIVKLDPKITNLEDDLIFAAPLGFPDFLSDMISDQSFMKKPNIAVPHIETKYKQISFNASTNVKLAETRIKYTDPKTGGKI